MTAALSVGAGCDTPTSRTTTTGPNPSLVQIVTLSNRADHISGGDALVQITPPADAASDTVRVTVGGRDVSSDFAKRADGRILGVVHGLADGDNKVTVDVGGQHASALTITNHSLGGPVFSGPRLKPFVCATPTGSLEGADGTPATNASGLTTLATAGDENCLIASEVKLFYRSSDASCLNPFNSDPEANPPVPAPGSHCFKPYDENAPAPADLKMTTTDAGVTVPYIVRIERGTMNRGIYDVVVLFDPKASPKATGWNPFAPQAGWNGKVVYSFGASSNQPRLQFRSEQHWNNEDVALSRGYLVAYNSMTDSLYNSNRTLMVETLMMMKEKIIDTYGEVKYVLGNGCSGGSINQLTAASIYPGLLDGIQPTCTYPDSETTAMEVVDCLQLVHAFSSTAWLDEMGRQALTLPQIFAKRAAVAGHVDQQGCLAWVRNFADGGRPGQYVRRAVDANGLLVPPKVGDPEQNNCQLPKAMVYNKDTNPTGIRCGTADNAVAIFGKVKDGSRARGTTDNTGVQYGLKALVSGAITPEEFVIVNEQAGGLDADSDFAAGRTEGDPDALAIAYRAGIVSDGAHLAQLPILDLRGFDETGIHHSWRSFSLRERLDKANGGHKNLVLWRHGITLFLPQNTAPSVESLTVMDNWITAIKGDTSGDPIEDVVVAAKPKEAIDFCYLTGDTTLSTKVTDIAMCDADARLKPHASPRQVAGGPVSENILKCELKPVDPADYGAPGLSAGQLERIKAVFPDGVCDFTKPGVGQQAAESPLDFTAGAGGEPFGSPPATKAN